MCLFREAIPAGETVKWTVGLSVGVVTVAAISCAALYDCGLGSRPKPKETVLTKRYVDTATDSLRDHFRKEQLQASAVLLPNGGMVYSTKFTIQNVLPTQVELVGRRASCGCLSIDITPDSVPAFEFATVTLSAQLGSRSLSKQFSADILDARTENLITRCVVSLDAYSVLETEFPSLPVLELDESGHGETRFAILRHRSQICPETVPELQCSARFAQVAIIGRDSADLAPGITRDRYECSVSVHGGDVATCSSHLSTVRLTASCDRDLLEFPVTLRCNPTILSSPTRLMLRGTEEKGQRVVLNSKTEFRIKGVSNIDGIAVEFDAARKSRVHVLTVKHVSRNLVPSEDAQKVTVSVDHPRTDYAHFWIYH